MLNSTEAADHPCRKVPRQVHSHAHGRACFFAGCPYLACRKAQKNSELYGFTEAGEIATPSPRRFPWENVA